MYVIVIIIMIIMLFSFFSSRFLTHSAILFPSLDLVLRLSVQETILIYKVAYRIVERYGKSVSMHSTQARHAFHRHQGD